MNQCRNGNGEGLPLTAKLEEIAGPLPRNLVLSVRRRRRRQEHRIAVTPIQILKAIITDALVSTGDGRSTVLESVPPAEPGDASLLVLRYAGRTMLMVAVAPSVIRSERLRRGTVGRNRDAERGFEAMRLADSLAAFDDEEEYED